MEGIYIGEDLVLWKGYRRDRDIGDKEVINGSKRFWRRTWLVKDVGFLRYKRNM